MSFLRLCVARAPAWKALLTMSCVLGAASGASAAAWRSAGWGRAWVTVSTPVTSADGGTQRILRGQTDDTAQDGTCVYLRVRRAGRAWPDEPRLVPWGTRSCGTVATFEHEEPVDIAGVRLYREDGRYLTLWGS